MTRAKKHLHISFATSDNSGKPLETSVFVDEICPPEERIVETVQTAELVKFIAQSHQPVSRIKTANAQWIDRELQQIAISATSLSSSCNAQSPLL